MKPLPWLDRREAGSLPAFNFFSGKKRSSGLNASSCFSDAISWNFNVEYISFEFAVALCATPDMARQSGERQVKVHVDISLRPLVTLHHSCSTHDHALHLHEVFRCVELVLLRWLPSPPMTHVARRTSLLIACIDLLQDHVFVLVIGFVFGFVIAVMVRFYDTLGGEILLNGRNIKEFNVRWLRSLVRSFLGLSPCLSASQPITLSVSKPISGPLNSH